VAIISIWDKDSRLAGHIGKLDFDSVCEDNQVKVKYYYKDLAEAKFIEIMNSLEEDAVYRIICQATEKDETSYVINQAVFCNYTKAFKVGNLYIYEVAILSFSEKLPRHSFLDSCMDEN